MLAAISLPNLNPVAIPLGPLEIHWYGLAYVVGLIFASWYMKRLVSNAHLWGPHPPTMTIPQVDDFFMWSILGVIGGGRLGYVLLYSPLYYLSNPLDIFKIWDGGMSFHGGFLGVVLACIIFGRRLGMGLDRMLDLGAASVPVGLGLGRVANFMNSELWGRATDVPWGVIFPKQTFARHPSQLYEAVLEGAVLFALVMYYIYRRGALQFPGRASGIFALIYGLSRILVEFFREPDRHIGYIAGQITLGMIYSLPLVAVGIWLLIRSRRTA
jgi:phosphatidylglycerol---prolipoprotein diacylglyceryl transferase